MYAIVEIAGKQFKVVEDQKLFVHRLTDKEGSKVSFDKVFLYDDGGKVFIGEPSVTGASVEAKILSHLKDDKIIVFKKKRRKGYRVKNGHRQALTELLIEKILVNGSKPKASRQEKSNIKSKPLSKKETKSKISTKEKKSPGEFKSMDLNSMTLSELKSKAKSKGITSISSMKKSDLIAVLSRNNK